MDLSIQRSAGNLNKEITAQLRLLYLESIQESEALRLGFFDTINDDTRVNALANVALSLAHELTNEEYVGSSAVTDDIILSGSSTADHGSCRMLDLHLVKENTSVFG